MSVLSAEWKKIRTSQLGRNASWMMFGQVISVVMQAVYFAILARLLGATDYGIFAGAFAFTNLAAQYSTLGSGAIFIRYVSGNKPGFAVYWGNILVLTFALGGVMVAVLTVLGHYILNPGSAALVIFAAIANCLCATLSTETGRVFQTFERMRTTAILNMSTNVVRTLTAGVMLITLHKATAFQWAAASTAVSALAAIAGVACVTATFGRPKIFPILFPKHGLEGFGHAIAGSTSNFYNDLDKTMLSHYGMNHANGVYTVAYRIIDIATMPIYSIRDAAMPRIFERGRTIGITASTELALKLMRRTIPLGILLTIGTFLVSPLITLLVGPGYRESVSALRWLALLPAFRSFHQMTGSAMTGSGFQRFRTGSQLGAALLNFGLNLFLIPAHGWLGAAWASLVTDGALCLANAALLRFCILKFSKTQKSAVQPLV
jgi:O-antigen/teichoic acid export membrane protein